MTISILWGLGMVLEQQVCMWGEGWLKNLGGHPFRS